MKKKEAPAGYWFTQSAIDNEENRIFRKRIAGFGDLDVIFELWSDSQKQEWETAHPEPDVE